MRRAVVLVLILLVALVFGACRKTARIANLDGRVTSVGPVYEDGDGLVTIHFSVSDLDTDPVEVVLERRVSGGSWERLGPCETGAPCAVVGSLRAVSTAERGGDAQHVVGWRAEGGLASGLELRMSAGGDPSRGVVWVAP